MTIVSRLEFAEITGLSTGTLSNRMTQGMPILSADRKKGRNTQIDTEVALRWLTEFEIKRRFGKSTPSSDNEDSSKVRNDIAIEQRRKLRIENDESEALLVPLEDVSMLFNEAVVSLASQLDGAAGKMAAGDAVLRDRLKDEHRRIRATFSDTLNSFANATQSVIVDEAATEESSVEVG